MSWATRREGRGRERRDEGRGREEDVCVYVCGGREEEEKGGMKGEGERRMCVFMCVEGGKRKRKEG